MRLKVSVDRRENVLSQLVEELRSLQESINGLKIEFMDDADIENQPNAGKYRDFAGVAFISHPNDEVLDFVTEELIDVFGWRIDIGPG